MSAKATFWAWDLPLDNSTQKLVLLKLADSANDDGVCWPSHTTIAAHTGLSRSTVLRTIKTLESMGLVSHENRFRNNEQTSNLYTLDLRCSTVTHPPCQSATPPVAQCHTESTNESKRESKVIKDIVQKDLHDEAFDYFWSNMQLRKVNKKKAKSSFKSAYSNFPKSLSVTTPGDLAFVLISDINERFKLGQRGIDGMHPTTYLNGERWNDEKVIEIQKGGNNTFSITNALEKMASGYRNELDDFEQTNQIEFKG